MASSLYKTHDWVTGRSLSAFVGTIIAAVPSVKGAIVGGVLSSSGTGSKLLDQTLPEAGLLGGGGLDTGLVSGNRGLVQFLRLGPHGVPPGSVV